MLKIRFDLLIFFGLCVLQEAAQALIYAGMAGSKLEGIQDKVNEYLDRVQALHNAGILIWQDSYENLLQ